jgi:hypothetical protein
MMELTCCRARRSSRAAILFLGLIVTLSLTAGAQTPAPEPFGPPSPSAPATPLPEVRVALSRLYYYIKADPKTGAPQMPRNVVATAEARNWPAGAAKPTTFLWHIFLDWDFKPYPTHHRIGDTTFTQPSPMKINLDEEIRGGTLTVYARTMLNGQEIFGMAQAAVLGENPPRKAVLSAFPPSRLGLIASKIGTVESDLCQFTSQRGPDPGGQPVVSRSNDVGLMQLNAPSEAITSADQVWDWRANLRRGLDIYMGKRHITVLASRHATSSYREPDMSLYQLICLNCARQVFGLPCLPPVSSTVPPLSERPGSGMLPDDPDPDHLNLSQIEREAIRRYNGGREYAWSLTPSPDTLDIVSAGWEIDATRGGLSPTSGAPDYVRLVLGARSGFVFPPPPKPKQKTASPSRRHHHRGAAQGRRK